jgi:hypothetical protein
MPRRRGNKALRAQLKDVPGRMSPQSKSHEWRLEKARREGRARGEFNCRFA